MSDAAGSSPKPSLCSRPTPADAPAGEPPWWEQLRNELRYARALRIDDPEHPLPPLGRFEGLKYQARGGFGVVFVARDPQLDRQVALKFCRVPTDHNRTTLMREAQLMAQLSHPNVVRVYETGWYGTHPFFVMEHAPGKNGDHFMFRWPPPTWREIVTVYAGAGAGLAALHEQGMVHGDFKPSNVLLSGDDWPLVTDFGLAHREASEGGCAGGTLLFSAPEVQMGQRPDASSDLWSFCVSLGQTLAGGEPLFEGKTHEEMLSSIFAGPPDTPEGVPEWLWAIVVRGLVIEPADRYASMRALLDDLERGDGNLEIAEPERVELPAESSSALELSVPPPSRTPLARGYRPFAMHVMNTGLTALLMAFMFMSVREPAPAQIEQVAERAQAKQPPTPERDAEAEQVRVASDAPAPASNCMTRGTPLSEVSETLEAVCTKIRQGELSNASLAWSQIRDQEYPESDSADYNSLVVSLATETKVVSDTFKDQAGKLSDPKLAEGALDRARAMEARYIQDYKNLRPSQP